MTTLSGFSLYFGKRIKGLWHFSEVATRGLCKLRDIPGFPLAKNSELADIFVDFNGMYEDEIRDVVRKAVRLKIIEHPQIIEQIHRGIDNIHMFAKNEATTLNKFERYSRTLNEVEKFTSKFKIDNPITEKDIKATIQTMLDKEEGLLSYHYLTDLGALRAKVRLEKIESFCKRWKITTEKKQCRQLISKASRLLDKKEAVYRKKAKVSPSLVLTRHLFPGENVRFRSYNGTLLTPEEVMWLFYTPQAGLHSLSNSPYARNSIAQNILESSKRSGASRKFPLIIQIERDDRNPYQFNITWDHGIEMTFLDDRAWTVSRGT